MAQMRYEDFVKFNQSQNKGSSSPKSRVGYFALKDDGDVGIVRFNIASLDDIRIVSKHTVKSAEGKIRHVSCLRSNPLEELSVCPLCEAGERVAYRAYVPLVYYTQDESGATVANGALWEQAPRIRETLQSFTSDYGDLRDYVFKIVRHGKKGDTATTYTILPANPNMYKEDIFKKDFSSFDSLDFERFVATKTAEEMHAFLEEGDFPFTKKAAPVTETREAVTASRPSPVVNTYTATAREEVDTVADTGTEEIRRPRRYTY